MAAFFGVAFGLMIGYWPITLVLVLAFTVAELAKGNRSRQLREFNRYPYMFYEPQEVVSQPTPVPSVFMAELSDAELVARGWQDDEVINGAPPFYVYQEQGQGERRVARRGTEMYENIRGGFR